MSNVVSLDARRSELKVKRFDPLAEFTGALDLLFEALDLLKEARDPTTAAAHQRVFAACEKLLRREERTVTWASL